MRQLMLLAAVALLAAADDPPAKKKQEQDPPKPGQVGSEPPKRAPADSSRDYVRFAFNFYVQEDSGGNPNVDEETMIAEPMILISKGVGDRLTLTLKLQGDFVGDPFGLKGEGGGDEDEDEGGGGAANVRTGASGGGASATDTYFRIDGGGMYSLTDQVKVGAGLSYSTETDYESRGGYVKGVYETPSKNDSFALRISTYFDTVQLKFFDGTTGGEDPRQTVSIGLAWSHILTPKTVLSLNYDLTIQEGFLATASNSVIVRGVEVREILPDSRQRHAIYGRVRHLVLPDLAIEPGVGFYVDDWGASAYSFELALFWEAIPETLVVRPSFRYHGQTGVDYIVATDAASIPAVRTQDSDLDDFTSRTLGVKLIWPKGLGDNTELEIAAEYTVRSDGLEWFSVTMGFQWRY